MAFALASPSNVGMLLEEDTLLKVASAVASTSLASLVADILMDRDELYDRLCDLC